MISQISAELPFDLRNYRFIVDSQRIAGGEAPVDENILMLLRGHARLRPARAGA